MTRKILIIEDEEALGVLYQEGFEALGYQTRWEASAREIERMSAEFPANLLLVDHGLSETERTGIESIGELKRYFPRAFIVVLSNYSDFLLKEKALQAGAHDYWLKVDHSFSDLTRKIERLFLRETDTKVGAS